MDKQKVQKALDDEMRKRINSLDLITAPLKKSDLVRLPKSMKYETLKNNG